MQPLLQPLLLGQCAAGLDGKLSSEAAASIPVCNVSTDTRTLASGDTFVALLGPNYDAHDHCQQAADKGASAVIVSRKVDCSVPQLQVADTSLALGRLASLWAARYQVPVVAITGSNGKTTVKEMVRSILAELGPVLATRGNLNNEIGVPLTLLALREEHQYAVVEMGANHVGEIGYLSKLASPTVAVVNNVSSAHLEGFGSLGAIAGAKSEIFLGLDQYGFAVINADDDYAAVMKAAAGHCEQLTFGSAKGVDVRGCVVDGEFTIQLRNGEIQPGLQLLGAHNQRNAVAAAAIASCLDVQPEVIAAGLARVKPVAGRLQRKQTQAGATVIDDSYNANPASARAAIQVLSEFAGERVLVLGDMRELGDDAQALHAEVGNLARESGISKLFAVGPLAAHAAHAFGESGVSFTDKKQLLEAVRALQGANTTFLVKGSRGSRMEELVEGLMARSDNGADCEATAS